MARHMTFILGALMVLIMAQSHPSLSASSRWTLNKQQLHHDSRAVGRDQLPLGIPLMVGESKLPRNLRPPSPRDSGSSGFTPKKRDLSPATAFAPPPPPPSLS
ncbi:hypothetical protein MRB53_029372 [Persea americana]|uniref:Uncharacterized protein n=1 Tax=Persea americana TaxID=3435 RepID=A0ACC2KIE4_PERAE|nr:hypothetical protein MRB53_029372 [Persea americana]